MSKRSSTTRLGSGLGLDQQIQSCVVCDQSQYHLLQLYACKSCTSVCTPHHKSLLRSAFKSPYRCLCPICIISKAEETSFFWLYMCTCCLLDCQAKARASVQDPKLSFLLELDLSFPGDVSFVVKGSEERIQAHRFILASKSPVFKKMMEIEMREKLTGIIQIEGEGMTVAVVRAAVKFMYTGDIEFSDEVLPEDVLGFAHRYDIQWLKDLCEIELVNKITTENVLKMLSIAYRFEAKTLKDKARYCFSCHPDYHETYLDNIFTNSEECRID